MPVEWVTVPLEPALEALEVGSGARPGTVIIGPAGVGKTTLARAAVARLGARFDRVDWVTATTPSAAIPFAAFSHLIDVPEAGKTAEVLRTARATLGDGRLLVVDDAHLLDKLSAALVHQLAVSGAASLIVTVSANGPVADEISTLWTDDLLERIDLDPPGHDDSRLATMVNDHVSALPATARRVLEYLAVDDPLPLAELGDLVGRDAVAEAESAGAITVDDGLVRPAHPLFVDAVRAALGGPELRRLRTDLVERLGAAPPRDVVAMLRLAVLALDSDRPQPTAEIVSAADEALRLGDLVLAERLGRAAVQRDAGLPARITLAYALAWQGRGRDADSVLAQVDPSTLSESELMVWALPRAANQFWMLSEPERATAFLKATRNKVSSPAAQVTLDALSATFAMNAGGPVRALQIANEVLASPSADDTAIGWAGAAAALSSARMGRFSDVDAFAERAIAAGHPGLLRFTSGFGQTTALMMTGELDRAQKLAQQLTDFAQLQQPGRAIGEVLVADVLIAKGELDTAVRLLRRAATALAPTGYSWGPLAWMLLAQALGQQGASAEAGKALSRAESRHGLKSMLFAPELALARAWAMSARGDKLGAIAAARDAARGAERGGQSAVALRALLDAVRLGDLRAVDGIARIGAQCDCAVGQLALTHARALAGHDSAALSDVSKEWSAIGMNPAAADAAAQAN
ncbi:AAA family ATPase [Mycolicibacterium moriokaense]|uniref:ATPase AAA n=1 Tax=Mycolicibacterium moriokaense TaxID=39691 RepID=A0AAD1M664_9MYCO|nr:ATP-binding protein [Mycolicibacterium moriokaense]MCV7042594.1 AAA family ATPase [Mycolicibacterium moriokaense]ORB23486.1 AAA family ATPase [Mycolicibacterium moriokaense]BBX01141.1 ATPase AAA [Mycolicibacterium moriokaense]